MTANDVEGVLAAAARAAWEEGCPVAAEPNAVAKIARRRLRSFKRRHPDTNDLSIRINDLAKGLCDNFEQDPSLVGPLIVDYRYLAGLLIEAFDADGGSGSSDGSSSTSSPGANDGREEVRHEIRSEEPRRATRAS